MAKNNQKSQKLLGECLCGSVSFELSGPLRDIVSCYCSECRKTSGNFVSATLVKENQIHFIEESGLAWFKNDLAIRGFCQLCGSNLFWRQQPENGKVSVMAGCLEAETGLKVISHIFVADKSDFHEIAGNAPQYKNLGKHETSVRG